MMTFQEFMAVFRDEAACRQYLADRRWPDGKVKCPKCGNEKVYASKARPFNWFCRNKTDEHEAPYRFSVLVGTIFENTNVPLVTWFKVLYTMLQSLKGISSRQIRRMFFGERSSLHTAWYICHRLRAGMKDDNFKQLMGIVEINETYIGGKERNKHVGKRGNFGPQGKTEVIGAIARKGNVVCQMVEDADFRTYDDFVRKAVSSRVSLIATDESFRYRNLRKQGYPHQFVTHKNDEYVRGEVHTQSLDSFWSLLKRGIIGTYHNVSKKYLPLYLNEFQFRHNNRKNPDIFGEAVAGC